MQALHIDRSKHPHPRRYRRALAGSLLGAAAGVALTVFGIYAATLDLEGVGLWLVSGVILGPSVVFLSAVAFATYLESLEKAKYGGVYEDEPAEEPRTAPGAHAH